MCRAATRGVHVPALLEHGLHAEPGVVDDDVDAAPYRDGALDGALESWDKRISTGQLNGWLKDIIAATPPPVRGGRQPRVMFATQAATRPPTFVLFTTGFLEAGYRRFLERKLREQFGFDGSPVRINVRVREKRERRK